MTSYQRTTSSLTTRSLMRRTMLGASFSIVATLLLTACGGVQRVQPAAAVPPVAPQVAANPPQMASKPAVAQTAASAAKPATEAASVGGECRALTVADIKAITGEDVSPTTPKEFAYGGSTCGNYLNAAGKPFVAVRVLNKQQDIDNVIKSVPADVYKVHEQPSGLGDQADLFKDQAQSPAVRYLVIRKGSVAVELMPFTGAKGLTDDQLFKLATKALSAS